MHSYVLFIWLFIASRVFFISEIELSGFDNYSYLFLITIVFETIVFETIVSSSLLR